MGEVGETEVEHAVEVVEGDAHVEAGFGGGEAIATRLLHDGQAIELEPSDGLRIKGLDGEALGGFEAGAEGSDAVFDEVQARALHDVIFVVVGGGDDFFGDAESGADFRAAEFAILEELEIGGGERGFDDFATVPKEEGLVSSASAAFAVVEGREELLFLDIIEVIVGADDETGIAVVFDEAAHERAGGVIGAGGKFGGAERREAAPEIEGVGEFIVPDFFGEEDLGFERGGTRETGVAPADQTMVFDYLAEMVWIQNQDVFQSAALD